MSEKVHARVSDDGEEPWLGIGPAMAGEASKGFHLGLLHGILGIVIVADQPAGKVVRGRDMALHVSPEPFFRWPVK